MTKPTLSTSYKDDILNTSTEGKRKYRMIYNEDATVSFEDVTPYDQTGSDFGAGDINRTNEAVNQSFDKNKLIRDMDAINAITQEGYAPDALALKEVNDSLTASDNLKFQFATDGEGNYGYLKGDDTFVPFKSGLEYDVNTFTIVGGDLKCTYPCQEYDTLTVKTNSSNTQLSVYGVSSIASSSGTLLKSITNNTTENIDVSNYDYVYFHHNSSQKLTLTITFE